jgi:hypothetical protein
VKRYIGSKAYQAHWLFILVLYAFFIGLGFYFLWDAWKHHPQPMHYGMALIFIALFSTMGGGSVPFFLNTLTSYEVDDTEIVQRRAFGIRRMRWRDVVQLREGGGARDGGMLLVDNGGQQLGIQFGTLADNGQGLRDTIVARLERLRARQIEEFAAQEQTLDSAPRASASALAVVGIVLILISFAMFLVADDRIRIPAFGMLGMGLLILVVTGYVLTRRITISAREVRIRQPWGEKRLLLHQVESVFVYQDSAQGNGFETITLCGNGTKMQFVSNMPDYPLLREAILRSVPSEALHHGERDRAGHDRDQTRSAVIILSVCCTMFVGMATYGLYREVTDIQRLAAHGAIWHSQVLPAVAMLAPLFATPLMIPGYLWMKRHNARKAAA